ncbi:DUF401 family protein [Thermosphaera chiliense]|uniref:DUF401 family protein n=1 Tax=Thermosphaera chiliense TaxID=3402707 RepID=A0A7M1USM3_9CREN|nr:DUF401 family protein [Thermosphaera aggregans]QOR94537.1 DUF401 family protein [Thermosphaera aggregans]
MLALDPVVVFAVSVCLAIVLVLRRVNIALAITTAFLVYSIPLLGLSVFNVVAESFNATMVNTVVSLTLAMVLANLYRSTRASREMVESFESLGWRTASIGVPAAIGLLPMPAGAYVSATMIDPVYSKAGFNGEEKTFLNYWFRHIWVSTWPLYQNIILASALLGLTYSEIFARTWFIMASSALAGIVFFAYISRNSVVNAGGKYRLKGLIHLWPFPLIAFLSITLNLPLYLALSTVVVLFLLLYRPGGEVVKQSVKKSLDPTLIGLIIVSLVFGNAIRASGLADTLAQRLAGYGALAVFTVPFSIVIATGFEFTFVALGFPALKTLLTATWYYTTLAFLGGFLGAMLSPAHACLVMSAKHFNTPIHKVYKYTVPAAVLTLSTTLLLLTLARMI